MHGGQRCTLFGLSTYLLYNCGYDAERPRFAWSNKFYIYVIASAPPARREVCLENLLSIYLLATGTRARNWEFLIISFFIY